MGDLLNRDSSDGSRYKMEYGLHFNGTDPAETLKELNRLMAAEHKAHLNRWRG